MGAFSAPRSQGSSDGSGGGVPGPAGSAKRKGAGFGYESLDSLSLTVAGTACGVIRASPYVMPGFILLSLVHGGPWQPWATSS